jgi:hypothetical protein
MTYGPIVGKCGNFRDPTSKYSFSRLDNTNDRYILQRASPSTKTFSDTHPECTLRVRAKVLAVRTLTSDLENVLTDSNAKAHYYRSCGQDSGVSWDIGDWRLIILQKFVARTLIARLWPHFNRIDANLCAYFKSRWGTENGVDYWLAANSWTANWGDQGYFKIRRGTNECSIEDNMVGGEVDLSSVSAQYEEVSCQV